MRKSNTVSGNDGWTAEELKMFPLFYLDVLAKIFMKIKKEGVWPKKMANATVALMPKTQDSAAVDELRLLTIFC